MWLDEVVTLNNIHKGLIQNDVTSIFRDEELKLEHYWGLIWIYLVGLSLAIVTYLFEARLYLKLFDLASKIQIWIKSKKRSKKIKQIKKQTKRVQKKCTKPKKVNNFKRKKSVKVYQTMNKSICKKKTRLLRERYWYMCIFH